MRYLSALEPDQDICNLGKCHSSNIYCLACIVLQYFLKALPAESEMAMLQA